MHTPTTGALAAKEAEEDIYARAAAGTAKGAGKSFQRGAGAAGKSGCRREVTHPVVMDVLSQDSLVSSTTERARRRCWYRRFEATSTRACQPEPCVIASSVHTTRSQEVSFLPSPEKGARTRRQKSPCGWVRGLSLSGAAPSHQHNQPTHHHVATQRT